MKKTAAALTLLLAATLALAACGGGSESGTGEKIVIGAPLCQTGALAPIDEPALRGAQLAVDELNKRGGVLGKQVELLTIDGKSDPATVGKVTKQMIDRGAAAIVAPGDFDIGGSASRAAQAAGMVGISPRATSTLFGSAVLGDKQFTMAMWDTSMGAVAAEYAWKQGWKSVYVLTDDATDHMKNVSTYFIARYEELGGEVLFEDTYTQGQDDVSVQGLRVEALQRQPDFIFVSSYMPDLAAIIRALRENGIEVPVVGGDSYDDPALFEALGALHGNDIFFVTHGFLSEAANPKYPDWAAAYKAKFGADPETVWILPGYDAVMLVADAMEEAGSIDGAEVAGAMEAMTFELFTGTLDWSDAASGHEPNKSAALVQVQGGKPAFIEWVAPESTPVP